MLIARGWMIFWIWSSLDFNIHILSLSWMTSRGRGVDQNGIEPSRDEKQEDRYCTMYLLDDVNVVGAQIDFPPRDTPISVNLTEQLPLGTSRAIIILQRQTPTATTTTLTPGISTTTTTTSDVQHYQSQALRDRNASNIDKLIAKPELFASQEE